MRLINYFLFFLATSVYLTKIPALFGITVLIFSFCLFLRYYKNFRIYRTQLLMFSTFIIISLVTILNLNFGNTINQTDIIYRLRFWFFQILLSISSYYFIYYEYNNTDKLSKFFKYSIFCFGIIGSIQLLLFQGGEFGKITLLTSEPSHAGGVLLFYLCMYLGTSGGIRNIKREKSFILISLFLLFFIGSKGAIITTLVFLLLYSLIQKKSSKIIWIGAFFVVVMPIFYIYGKNLYLNKIFNLYGAMSEYGMDGLSYEYQVWDSFIVRISGWVASINIFLKYPFGVGAGGFGPLFKEFIRETGIGLSSVEIKGILSGYLYATPKSYFLEFLVSGGVFLVFIFLFLFVKKFRKTPNRILKVCLIIILFQGFLVELAPYFTYLVCIYSLVDKSVASEMSTIKRIRNRDTSISGSLNLNSIQA